MRTIAFIWFWKVCWDDDRPWTFIFSMTIPFIAIGVICEIFLLGITRKLSFLSAIQCLSVTAFINEFILKPSVNALPLDNAGNGNQNAPTTGVAMALAGAVLHACRYFTSGPKDLYPIIGWSLVFVFTFLAYPLLYYLSWAHEAISLVPGIIVGLFWAFVMERTFFEPTILMVGNMLKLENDITGEAFQHEQDLLPR
jgi:hypothetical protein